MLLKHFDMGQDLNCTRSHDRLNSEVLDHLWFKGQNVAAPL